MITSERIVLCAWERSDLETFTRWFNNPEATVYLGNAYPALSQKGRRDAVHKKWITHTISTLANRAVSVATTPISLERSHPVKPRPTRKRISPVMNRLFIAARTMPTLGGTACADCHASERMRIKLPMKVVANSTAAEARNTAIAGRRYCGRKSPAGQRRTSATDDKMGGMPPNHGPSPR